MFVLRQKRGGGGQAGGRTEGLHLRSMRCLSYRDDARTIRPATSTSRTPPESIAQGMESNSSGARRGFDSASKVPGGRTLIVSSRAPRTTYPKDASSFRFKLETPLPKLGRAVSGLNLGTASLIRPGLSSSWKFQAWIATPQARIWHGKLEVSQAKLELAVSSFIPGAASLILGFQAEPPPHKLEPGAASLRRPRPSLSRAVSNLIPGGVSSILELQARKCRIKLVPWRSRLDPV